MKHLHTFFWLFVFSMPALLSAQTQRSASSQSKTDNKVETKLTSLRKQLEEATGSQQQIGHWLYAMIERNLESMVDIQENAVHLDTLTNALRSKQSVEVSCVFLVSLKQGIQPMPNLLL